MTLTTTTGRGTTVNIFVAAEPNLLHFNDLSHRLGLPFKSVGRKVGNSSCAGGLADSRYLPDFNGKFLFWKDVEEAPYRIDRMLSTLKLMGALDKIAGFMFGACVGCRPIGGYR